MNISKLLAIPRSFILCIKVFGFKKALSIPMLISNKTKIKGLRKGSIELSNYKRFAVAFGFGGTDGVIENNYSSIIIGKNGKVVFKGKAQFSVGSSLRVDSGKCVFGNNFSANKNFFVSCSEMVSFGDDVLIGWNVNVRDADGHKIYHNGVLNKNTSPVEIGNHVWIAAYADVLKGVSIPDDCVVGYRSLVNKSILKCESLIVGSPAKPIQENIKWEI